MAEHEIRFMLPSSDITMEPEFYLMARATFRLTR